MDSDQLILINRKLTVRESATHGYGLFVNEDIKCGEIITQSPVIIFSAGTVYPEVLQKYMFAFNGKTMIALNYLSYINSSANPNAAVSFNDLQHIITITAVTDILLHQEITLKYMN